MTDYILWKKNIFSAIEVFSNKSFQEEAWLGNSEIYTSSFEEVIMILFDDNGLEDFLWENESVEKLEFKEDLIIRIKLLKESLEMYLKKYKRNSMTDKDLLQDPLWDDIVLLAKDIINNWNN